MNHELKTFPIFFDAIREGRKTFEIGKNDRGFKVGDILILREYHEVEQRYTGPSASVRVIYMTDHAQQDGYVVLGIEK